MRQQAAGHQSHGRQIVKHAEFAQCVGDINGASPMRAFSERRGALPAKPRDIAAALGVARRYDEQRIRCLRAQALVRIERDFVFAGMGGGGEPDWARADLAAAARRAWRCRRWARASRASDCRAPTHRRRAAFSARGACVGGRDEGEGFRQARARRATTPPAPPAFSDSCAH
jgi:hypothetical protein